MKILTIEASIHNSISQPYEMGEEVDGSYYELSKGIIPANHDGEQLEALMEEADEVYEVDSLASRTNSRRVK
jgi:Iap family predicted aminopeptidase